MAEMATETNGDVVWKRGESASEHEEVWDDSALIEAYDRAVSLVKDEIAQKNSGSANSKRKGKNRKLKVDQAVSWKVGDYCQAVFSEDGLNYEAYIKEVNQARTSCLVQYVGYGNEEIVPISDLSPSLGKDARAQQETRAGCSTQFFPKKEGSSETSSQRSFSQSKRRTKHRHNWRYSSHSSPGCQLHNEQSSSSSVPGPPGGLLSWLKTVVPPQTHADAKSRTYSCGCLCSGHSCQISHQAPHQIPPPPFPLDHDLADNEEALAAMLMSWYMSGYHTGYYQALQQARSVKHGSSPCCMHSAK